MSLFRELLIFTNVRCRNCPWIRLCFIWIVLCFSASLRSAASALGPYQVPVRNCPRSLPRSPRSSNCQTAPLSRLLQSSCRMQPHRRGVAAAMMKPYLGAFLLKDKNISTAASPDGVLGKRHEESLMEVLYPHRRLRSRSLCSQVLHQPWQMCKPSPSQQLQIRQHSYRPPRPRKVGGRRRPLFPP